MHVNSIAMQLYRSCAVLWALAVVFWRPALSQDMNQYSEAEAAKYLINANQALALWTNQVVHSDWNWLTNLTNENAQKKVLHAHTFFADTYEYYIKFMM